MTFQRKDININTAATDGSVRGKTPRKLSKTLRDFGKTLRGQLKQR